MSSEATVSEALEVVTAFMVVLTKSGGVNVHTSNFPAVTIDRPADLVDIESIGLRLASEAGRQLMAQALLPESGKTTSDIVSEALAKRSE